MRATVRAARTRAAHLLLRMSPGHSRCASIASPAQRRQYTSVPRYALRRGERRETAQNKEALRRISRLLKVAATYSPTTQCSTIGDAELNDPVRNGKGWDLREFEGLTDKVRLFESLSGKPLRLEV